MAGTIGQLDREIAELEARLERLKAVRAVLADDPKLSADLVQILLRPVRDGAPPVIEPLTALDPKSEIQHSTKNLERLLKFFRGNNNQWKTLRAMSEEIGISHNSISFLTYTSRHKNLFERSRNKANRVVFRLKPPQKSDRS